MFGLMGVARNGGQQSAPSPPSGPTGDGLLTEDGDFLVTEDGDYLVEE